MTIRISSMVSLVQDDVLPCVLPTASTLFFAWLQI